MRANPPMRAFLLILFLSGGLLTQCTQDREASGPVAGFDSKWHVLESDPPEGKLTDSEMMLTAGGYAHDGILPADEISFDLMLAGEGRAAIQVSLFSPTVDQPTPSVVLSFSYWDDRVWIQATHLPGSAGEPVLLGGDDLQLAAPPLSVSLTISEEEMGITTNGEELFAFVLPPEERRGGVLRFEAGGPYAQGANEVPIRVSRFVASR
ncbi:MAG: hypothetical protein AAGJ31_06085 [Verrucomicrobiota bacterium]